MKVMTMGLDMYAYKTKEILPTEVDFKVKDAEELHTWWKHPNLHGWMELLYRVKGGKETSFNLVNLALTSDDLDQLEREIIYQTLPFTQGFFFGDSDGSEADDDLAFITEARDALKAGYSVFYSSWW
jgi:hypothetical protein